MSYFPTDIPYMSDKEMKENGIKQKEVGEKVGTDELWGAINYIEIYLGVLKNGLIKYEDKDMSVDEAYQRGLDDAWEAARKIAQQWEEDTDTEHRLVIDDSISVTLNSMSANEAITKLKAYEEQKANDEIKVGDEVISKFTKTKGILLEPETQHLLARVIVPNDRWSTFNIRHANLTKTGRHFNIEKLLEAMKE